MTTQNMKVYKSVTIYSRKVKVYILREFVKNVSVITPPIKRVRKEESPPKIRMK